MNHTFPPPLQENTFGIQFIESIIFILFILIGYSIDIKEVLEFWGEIFNIILDFIDFIPSYEGKVRLRAALSVCTCFTDDIVIELI